MRLDRSISLGIVHPLQKAWTRSFCTSKMLRLPILMYHSISDTSERGVSEYYRVCTSREQFAQHMEWLSGWGYRGVSLSDGIAMLKQKNDREDKRKLVAITFDDGFQDFETSAAPILQNLGFSATMYLATAFVGEERQTLRGRACLVRSEVRRLHQAGFEFGSHTVNHPRLVELSWPQIATELRDSKVSIEQMIGAKVRAFAYPYAFPQAQTKFVREFRALLASVDYQSCVTTMIGRADHQTDLFSLPRLPVNSADDPALLRGKLEGAYDWMALPQFLRKRSFLQSVHSQAEILS